MTTCPNHPDLETSERCARCGVGYCPNCLVTIEGRSYCARCKDERLLDIRSGVDPTKLPLASNWKRFGAIFVDGLITTLPLYFLMIMFLVPFMIANAQASNAEPPLWINFIGFPLMFVNLIYEGLMTQRNGQTVGKKALGIRIVQPDGRPITQGQAWGRAGARLLLGCCWILDYIPAFFNAERTTLHDLLAKTRVVDVT